MALLALLIAVTKVVVLPYAPFPGVPPKDAQKLTELLGQELRGRQELRVVEPAPEPLHPQNYDALAWAREAFGKAQDLEKQGKRAQSIEQLERAISLLSTKPVTLDDEGGKLLTDSLQLLASQRPDDAELAQLVRLSPEPRATDFPQLTAMRRKLLAEPRATLRLMPPPGAGNLQAWFDGRPLPGLPIELRSALPGEHFVRVDSWASRVVLIAGATTTLAPVPGLEGQLLTGELDRAAVMAAGHLARNAGADAAIFGAVVRRGDELRLQSFAVLSKGDRLLQLEPLDVDRELLGAMVQLVRVGDDVVAKLSSPAQEPPLPIALTVSTPLPSVVVAPAAFVEPAVAAELSLAPLVPEPPPLPLAPLVSAKVEPAHALVVPNQRPTDDLDAPAPPPAIKRLEAPRQSLLSEELKTQPQVEPPKSRHTALWIVAGAVVLGAAGAGGYYLWNSTRSPSTATVSATWGH